MTPWGGDQAKDNLDDLSAGRVESAELARALRRVPDLAVGSDGDIMRVGTHGHRVLLNSRRNRRRRKRRRVVVAVCGPLVTARSPVSPEAQLVTSASAKQAVASKRPDQAGALARVPPRSAAWRSNPHPDMQPECACAGSSSMSRNGTSTCSRACELERNRAGRPRSVWGCCVATVPPVALADFERNREPWSSRCRGTRPHDSSPRHRPPVALRAVSALLGIGALAFAVALMIS